MIKKPGKKVKISAIVVIFLVFVVIAAVAYFMLKKNKNKKEENDKLEEDFRENETIFIFDSIYGKFKCFAGDKMICRNVRENKVWEKNILDKILAYYKHDTNMIDIGCNYGCHTVGVANEIKKKNSKGKIYAFDPQPRIFKLFQENVSMNDLDDIVVGHECGLGDQNEEKIFRLPKNYDINDNPGALSLLSPSESKAYEDVRVQIRKLDDYNIQNVSVIKLDVEGYELDVLEGAKKTILENKPIIFIEIWGWKEGNKERYFDWIHKNFSFYDIQHIENEDYILIPKN